MAIRCPICKREYDVTLFEFQKTINCICGRSVSLEHKEIFENISNDPEDENERVMEIKRLADKISFLIVSTDYPKINIEIGKERLKERINELFPDKLYLYDLIYKPRFRRLNEQFGSED